MPAFSIAVAGDTQNNPGAAPAGLDLLEPTSYRRIELASSRTAGTVKEIPIDDLDVVALKLDGGFRLWMRGEQLRVEVGRPPSRDGGAWQLASGLALEDAERGLGIWVIKALEIFGINPISAGIGALADHVERDNPNRILRYDPAGAGTWTFLPDGLPETAADEPVLLLIHGTFSTTRGSFGGLFEDRRAVLRLIERYGTRIYGYEHRTLTEDPIDNLLALIPQLPKQVRLHLLSHSRGGLVGDLLALGAGRGQAPPFGPEDLAQFDRGDATRASARGAQRAKLEQLGGLLKAHDIRLERFVRVASPSRGTTLASGRLDRWFSILANLAELTGAASPLASGFLDLTVAVTRMATDPDELPGLAAMTPGSPLVRMLNGAAGPVPGALSVVAGDIQAEGLWSRAKLLIPDLFYAGDHDLVVNTGSMYGGPSYQTRNYLFDRGSAVNHFSYFINQSTAPKVLEALVGAQPAAGFAPITAELVSEPARGARAGDQPRPLLVVLPGIMGSTLAVNGRPVWLDLAAIAAGGIAGLAIDAGHRVTPEGLMSMAYGDLLNYFAKTHEVLPFPFDWRLSIETSAATLAATLESKLDQAERHRQPVRLLAHSMGGLVARAMIAEHPRLWRRVLALGGRLVLLGTPNGGSWEILRLLTGRAGIIKKLALVDLEHRKSDLLGIIGAYPGVLELLPEDDRDFFRRGVWEQLQRDDQSQWPVPGTSRDARGGDRLEQAGRVRRRLRDQVQGAEGMLYVAGQAPNTTCDLRVQDEPQPFFDRSERTLRFFSSRRGDGSVLWEDGPLPGMPVWYMAGVAHGNLASHRPGLTAIRDLLVHGTTSDLAQRPPVSRGGESLRPVPEREPAYYPDTASILISALGMSPTRVSEPRVRPVAVSVVHGNLAFARHAVAVGHYAGDTIIAAEAYLDRVLGGRLRASQELDLYPGPLGTHAYFAHPHSQGTPRGALVVGLGAVGELSPAQLTNSFARALLAYARGLMERNPTGAGRTPTPGNGTDSALLEIRLTSLLIGTGAGGFSVSASVLALMRGIVRANAALAGSDRSRSARIVEFELIEIRDDLAIEAAHTVTDASQDPELDGQFAPRTAVREGQGGHRAGYDRTDPGWWHRLQIVSDDRGDMHFTFLTQRARAEQSLLATQRALVDGFVAQAIGDTANGAQTSRTLFEMLLPNRLKDGNALRGNLVLVLDEASARFPWELLQDRWSGDIKPPAVERGTLRQLSTHNFRADPRLTVRERALVIGEPRSNEAPLPGARAEAERVRDTLEGRGFKVSTLVGAEAGEILSALHADAYQILHLAGHGVHRERLGADLEPVNCRLCNQPLPPADREIKSGMIIGPGQVLTAADVKQMRQVPELVFINCCHLGRTDADSGQPQVLNDANRLAANLAVAFIEMGVRAVIAAGWAVDDAAALTFCETFYHQMDLGQPFGESVRLAREATWKGHPAVNTWGAYQCYGDPDFKIRNRGAQSVNLPVLRGYMAPSEAITELRNLVADAQVAAREDISKLRERLHVIDQRLEQTQRDCGEAWCRRGDILAERGLACHEIGLFDAAVRDLDAALRSEDSGIARGLIEHRARCQARLASQHHAAGDTPRALAILNALAGELELGRQGAAYPMARVETLSGIYWRRIQVLERTKRKAELDAILKLYDDAVAARPDAAGDPLGVYTRLLWLSARYLLAAYSQKTVDDVCPDFDAWCDRIEAAAGTEDLGGLRPDISALEVALLRTLRDRERLEREGGLAERQSDLARRLTEVLVRGLSERQWSWLDNHLALCETLLGDATVKPVERAKDAFIAAELRRLLAGHSI
jgi:pimeloyl-ACP methyl ester carboxylesterase